MGGDAFGPGHIEQTITITEQSWPAQREAWEQSARDYLRAAEGYHELLHQVADDLDHVILGEN